MVYLTPLEMGQNERLVSSILESFSYSQKDKEITWNVRQGLKFEDDTLITTEDVAFSVVRMAFARPKFPVIKEVVGIENWSKSKQALSTYPEGIKVIGNTVKIRFSEEVDHPLYRFVLELFSIVPKKCIDLSTNKPTCKELPASGYFKKVTEGPNEIRFERRKNVPTPTSETMPEVLTFKYIPTKTVAATEVFLDENAVIAANEVSFSREELQKIEGSYLSRSLPKSRFAAVLLNPTVDAFKDRDCRAMFAEKYRENLVKAGMNEIEVEGSITSQILPGYAALGILKTNSKSLTQARRAECEQNLKASKLSVGMADGIKFPTEEKALIATLEHFGKGPKDIQIFATRAELTEKFSTGVVSMRIVASGFWPQDPFGDLQMLFTPNLHKDLQHIAKDTKLQEMIESLRKPLEPGQRRKQAEEFNQYLFDQALVNVYRHTKRFYLSMKSKEKSLVPLALVSPAPWQVFD